MERWGRATESKVDQKLAGQWASPTTRWPYGPSEEIRTMGLHPKETHSLHGVNSLEIKTVDFSSSVRF